jgi:hypothetical protein
MKRFAIAAAIAAVAVSTSAFAAPEVQVPKHKCEAAPEVPGRVVSQQRGVRERFEKDLKAYQDCMTAYLEERKAAMKAHQEAANATIEEYNAAMRAINEAQKAAN